MTTNSRGSWRRPRPRRRRAGRDSPYTRRSPPMRATRIGPGLAAAAPAGEQARGSAGASRGSTPGLERGEILRRRAASRRPRGRSRAAGRRATGRCAGAGRPPVREPASAVAMCLDAKLAGGDGGLAAIAAGAAHEPDARADPGIVVDVDVDGAAKLEVEGDAARVVVEKMMELDMRRRRSRQHGLERGQLVGNLVDEIGEALVLGLDRQDRGDRASRTRRSRPASDSAPVSERAG